MTYELKGRVSIERAMSATSRTPIVRRATLSEIMVTDALIVIVTKYQNIYVHILIASGCW